MHAPASNPASTRRNPFHDRLHAFGWREAFHSGPWPGGVEPARVLAWSRGLALVALASGEAWCSPSGRFRDRLDLEGLQPCAGDWLWVEPGSPRGRIRDLMPRASLLARQEAGPSGRTQPLAANVDLVCIAMGLDRDFNPARLERFLALAWGSGATPVILLTKADLVPDPLPYVARVQGSAPGVEVLALSVRADTGIEAVRRRVHEGLTAVLVGSSGVGKSTLLNALLGEEARRTQEVRASDGRGRHTTSLRELFLLPTAGCLIDTPGLREVGLPGGAADLDAAFSDVEAFAEACRFRDCAHGAEPGCAVQAALGQGLLDPHRYQAYLQLRREVAYAAARADERLWREREQRWKGIAKQQRKLGRS